MLKGFADKDVTVCNASGLTVFRGRIRTRCRNPETCSGHLCGERSENRCKINPEDGFVPLFSGTKPYTKQYQQNIYAYEKDYNNNGMYCIGADDAGGSTVPYSTPIADDSAWKIINVVEGSNAWEVKTTSDETGYDTDKVMKYNWDTRHAADDWLISPAVSLEGGKEYKVKIRCNIHKQGNR